MHILISNDDGVFAEGINVLAEVLSDIATVTVVAPDRNRSGASNSLTLENPLRVRAVGENRYAVQGTPTDSVHVALNALLTEKVDFVIAGINMVPTWVTMCCIRARLRQQQKAFSWEPLR